MNHINKTDMVLSYPSYKLSSYDINKELYRGELYCNLLKDFTTACLNNLNENVFSHKKTTYRTITNLLSSWFFTLYQYYNFNDDVFYPTECNYMDTLIKTLKDYCSIYMIDDLDAKINNIINSLLNNYTNLLLKLSEYKENNNIMNISKNTIIQKRDSINIVFYKFTLTKYHSISNKLNNIINNIIIPYNLYNNMVSRFNQYIANNNIQNVDVDTIIWIILFRYQLLSSNNNQLAVLENILEQMKTDFNLTLECFASAINGSLTNYCSIYYDMEKYFGSIGSFFQITPTKGTFSFNPPYQYDIINNGINKILMHLDNTNDILSFIITIPIWDTEGKKYMADNVIENNNNIILYEDFHIMNNIKISKYFRGLRMISKEAFTYYDHNFHLYKNKTIQNTYVIVMSNVECNYIDTINNYDFFNYK